ncbi:hypothetical protein GIB67_041965 [Kingdonia uniflora]|uniref:ATPase AAA-type core domain-containing protein n=1 Tax=Kingdonia uniflora TaxID=39325 RepID=A0A7J7P084_9MAGN|nr:hypothetical protein GIB67_041965 [Kingdonia uniflora]
METSSSSSSNTTTLPTTSAKKQWRAEEAIAGNTEALQALRELITYPIYYSKQFRRIGKIMAKRIAASWTSRNREDKFGTRRCSRMRHPFNRNWVLGTNFSNGPQSVHRAYLGEGERILREAFAEAATHSSGKPTVIFFDEIDAICPRGDSRREQGIHIVSQLVLLMDANKPSSTSRSQVVVVASTNSYGRKIQNGSREKMLPSLECQGPEVLTKRDGNDDIGDVCMEDGINKMSFPGATVRPYEIRNSGDGPRTPNIVFGFDDAFPDPGVRRFGCGDHRGKLWGVFGLHIVCPEFVRLFDEDPLYEYVVMVMAIFAEENGGKVKEFCVAISLAKLGLPGLIVPEGFFVVEEGVKLVLQILLHGGVFIIHGFLLDFCNLVPSAVDIQGGAVEFPFVPSI